ncbi:NAD(P)H-dependent oxidoreductase [Caproiciproducens sp.]
MKALLFVNACVNRETSRTNRLSKELIKLLQEKEEYAVTELVLEEENIQPLNSKTLGKRLALSQNGDFSDGMFRYSRQIAAADCIVIAAPYWEFTFPAMLKNYMESSSMPGITYQYDESGSSVGLCGADNLYYVTTCGGYVGNANLGYETVKALAGLFGIKNSYCIMAEGLDAKPTEVESIMEAAIHELPQKIQ